MRKLVLVAAAVVSTLSVAPPASAEFFVSYGTGVTSCTITARDQSRAPNLLPWWRIQAKTECDRPIEQSLHIFNASGEPFDGGLCSGFTARCFSGDPESYWVQTDSHPDGELELHVSLRAPNGEGWLGSPQNCTGIGTDNLRCVFTPDVTWNVCGVPDLDGARPDYSLVADVAWCEEW